MERQTERHESGSKTAAAGRPLAQEVSRGFVIAILLVAGLGVWFYVYRAGQSTNPSYSSTLSTPTTGTEAGAAVQPADKIEISNTTFKIGEFEYYEVVGEATNTDSTPHSVILKATFYDANNKIVGTAVGSLNDLAPGDTKTFNLTTTDDVTGHARFKVQVDVLI